MPFLEIVVSYSLQGSLKDNEHCRKQNKQERKSPDRSIVKQEDPRTTGEIGICAVPAACRYPQAYRCVRMCTGRKIARVYMSPGLSSRYKQPHLALIHLWRRVCLSRYLTADTNCFPGKKTRPPNMPRSIQFREPGHGA